MKKTHTLDSVKKIFRNSQKITATIFITIIFATFLSLIASAVTDSDRIKAIKSMGYDEKLISGSLRILAGYAKPIIFFLIAIFSFLILDTFYALIRIAKRHILFNGQRNSKYYLSYFYPFGLILEINIFLGWISYIAEQCAQISHDKSIKISVIIVTLLGIFVYIIIIIIKIIKDKIKCRNYRKITAVFLYFILLLLVIFIINRFPYISGFFGSIKKTYTPLLRFIIATK